MNFDDSNFLRYKTLRTHIKSGDILLCSGKMLYSKLIKKATNSKWSHVAFIMRINSIDRVMVLESVETKGVRVVPLSGYLSNYEGSGSPYPGEMIIGRHRDFPASNIDHFSKMAIDLLGHPYDWKEIIRITSRLSLKWLGFERKFSLKRNRAYICSEYVYECYKSVGIEIPHGNGFVTPGDFYNDKNTIFQDVF